MNCFIGSCELTNILVKWEKCFMNCFSDSGELTNTIVGGIVTGVTAAFLFVYLSNILKNIGDSRKYKYLETPKGIEYDWTCYSMKEKNGRKREDTPNDSNVTINHEKGNILNIRLKQKKGEIWNGKLTMMDKYFGTLYFRYEDQHEYGAKDVFVGEEMENGKKYDFLFLIGKGKDYGNELLRRERKDH